MFEIWKLSFSFKSIKGVLRQVHKEKIFVMTSVLTELVQDGNLYKSKPTFFFFLENIEAKPLTYLLETNED